ncbi:hypothetical protein A3E47_01475, partial [Candidatus Peribacteria bacterium RIFCSPHIGHO2_12_FULL_54_10]
MNLRYAQRVKILVTGSSGTIGTRLCEKLLALGHDVHGMDRRPNTWNKDIQRMTTHIDLLNWNDLRPTTYDLQPDIVVHLAANARVYDLVEDPRRALENMTTTFNILEWARLYGIQRFIFASSREVYGNYKLCTTPIAEENARIEHCESPYTASKIAGEALVQAYTRCYELHHIILRFSNVYGMYDDSDRVVPLFLRRARKNEPLAVFGEEKCLDFTYIDDTVAGIIAAIEKFDTVKNDTYNIANGAGTTIVHLAEKIKELTASSSLVTVGESRTGEVIRYVADVSKAKKVLGYAPQTSFVDGIRKTVERYSKVSPLP